MTMEMHASMIDRMDQNIGRILMLLDETKTAENTLVVFISDNGASSETPNTPWIDNAVPGQVGSYLTCGASWANAQSTPFRKYKKYGQEGGRSTPCIIRWPAKVKPGTWTDSVAHIIDLQPTFMEVVGLDPEADLPKGKRSYDGESMATLLSGGSFVRKKPIYLEWNGNRAIRDGNWKATFIQGDKKWELFDIATDRTELNDLASKHPQRLTKMTHGWKQWAVSHGVLKKAAKPISDKL